MISKQPKTGEGRATTVTEVPGIVRTSLGLIRTLVFILRQVSIRYDGQQLDIEEVFLKEFCSFYPGLNAWAFLLKKKGKEQ